MCCTGGEAFKRRLVLSVVIAIAALNNFVLLLKSFIMNPVRKVHNRDHKKILQTPNRIHKNAIPLHLLTGLQTCLFSCVEDS